MSTRDRAAKLLGAGHAAEVVATALGVSPGYISQLLSDETFALTVSELRFTSLQEATGRDEKYDALEDRLLEKLDNLLPFMLKPGEVTRSLQAMNMAKRRGAKSDITIPAQASLVNIVLPTVIHQKLITNQFNQVVQVGDQDLTTISTKHLLELAKQLSLPRGTYDAGEGVRETVQAA